MLHQLKPVSLLLLLTLAYTAFAGNQDSIGITHLRKKAALAKNYCVSKQMNESICILIDMRMHSGKKRFFVWDFQKDTVLYACLVSHGCCNNPWSDDWSKEKPGFSNEDGSHCSSLGQYRIGARGNSSWGVKIKYTLHGLVASNRNATKRAIVFHSWEAVPDKEIYPRGTPEGWGCPSVSNKSFQYIDILLKNAKRPVLMWIYTD